MVPIEIFKISRQVNCLDLECTVWPTFWVTLIGHGSKVNLGYKAFVMLLQCYFAYPLICHPNGRTLSHILGKREGHHLLLTAGRAWKLAFAHKPGWGVLCCVELQGGHSGQSFDYVLSHLIKAGEGWRQGSAHRLGLRGYCFYCRSGWGWKPGSTHKLDQGGVPLSSCNIVMEDRAPLTDTQERNAPLLLQGGVENRVLRRLLLHIQWGGAAMWLFHGIHLENGRCD